MTKISMLFGHFRADLLEVADAVGCLFGSKYTVYSKCVSAGARLYIRFLEFSSMKKHQIHNYAITKHAYSGRTSKSHFQRKFFCTGLSLVPCALGAMIVSSAMMGYLESVVLVLKSLLKSSCCCSEEGDGVLAATGLILRKASEQLRAKSSVVARA